MAPRKSPTRGKEPLSSPPRRSSRSRQAVRHDCQACQEEPKAKRRRSGSQQKNVKLESDRTTTSAASDEISQDVPSVSGPSSTPSKPAAPPPVPLSEPTVSSQLRQEGNVLYKRAQQEGLPSIIQMSRLEDAVRRYQRAASAADGPNRLTDWSSAMKNCGMATKRMAQESLLKHVDEEATKSLSLFYQSLKFMSQALMAGGESRGESWRSNLHEEMEASYWEVLEVTQTMEEPKEKLRELYQATQFLPGGVVLAGAKYHIADMLFKESVRFLESGDYKESLMCLHDINQPVEEALGILRGTEESHLDPQTEELLLDLKVLQTDTVYHISTAESMQARKCGERVLEKILQTDEFVDMELVWNAVDWFKQASLKAAELDLEQEAAALSFLGLINQKFLFSRTKAKRYYRRCLELVEAAKPKTFTGEEWYKQCVSGFQKIQDDERRRDETEQQKIRQKILDTLKAEIAALRKADSSSSDLLEHVYKHHSPSKEPKFTKAHLEALKKLGREGCNLEKQKNCKKLLLKACQDFHPDKFREKEGETEEEAARRKVLMEEIMKMITRYYEQVKLC